MVSSVTKDDMVSYVSKVAFYICDVTWPPKLVSLKWLSMFVNKVFCVCLHSGVTVESCRVNCT